jgi:hypothetical protein
MPEPKGWSVWKPISRSSSAVLRKVPGTRSIPGLVLARALTEPCLERPHGLLLLAPRLASAWAPQN